MAEPIDGLHEGDSQQEQGYEIVCVDTHGIFHVFHGGHVVKRYTADSWSDVWRRLEADITSGRVH